MTIRPLVFELCYRREAYKRINGTFVRDADKDDTLPERPPQFSPAVGPHRAVAARADELNDAQKRSGFIHYFFFPEVLSK